MFTPTLHLTKTTQENGRKGEILSKGNSLLPFSWVIFWVGVTANDFHSNAMFRFGAQEWE